MRKTFTASDVKIIHSLIPKRLQKQLSALMAMPIWAYGWKSNAGKDEFPYWHAHFAGGDSKSRRNCEEELFAAPELSPILDLWQALKAGPLSGHEPLRIYANGHTFGVDGRIHTDSKDSNNYFSTIYYAHPVWRPGWAGETMFYSKDREQILASVSPKPGRIASFPGAMPHCAHSPTRDCPALRVTIVIKTQRKIK